MLSAEITCPKCGRDKRLEICGSNVETLGYSRAMVVTIDLKCTGCESKYSHQIAIGDTESFSDAKLRDLRYLAKHRCVVCKNDPKWALTGIDYKPGTVDEVKISADCMGCTSVFSGGINRVKFIGVHPKDYVIRENEVFAIPNAKEGDEYETPEILLERLVADVRSLLEHLDLRSRDYRKAHLPEVRAQVEQCLAVAERVLKS